MTEEDIRRIVSESVEQTLTRIGIDPDQPLEFQKDMAYLRGWRTSSETVKRQGLMTAIGVLTTGFIGLVWMTITKTQGH